MKGLGTLNPSCRSPQYICMLVFTHHRRVVLMMQQAQLASNPYPRHLHIIPERDPKILNPKTQNSNLDPGSYT